MHAGYQEISIALHTFVSIVTDNFAVFIRFMPFGN